MANLKPGIKTVQKGKLHYVLGSDGRVVRYTPWLGDLIAPLYDAIQRNSTFPTKLGAELQKHYAVLKQELAAYHVSRTLELGTGSGSAIEFIAPDNSYTGSDISPGLLKQAVKQFAKAGFVDPEFYVVSADDLPFADGEYDLCLCILSLNFIGNVERVFDEVKRVLIPGGVFVCSVPVPERNRLGSNIHGVLYPEAELEKMCNAHGFNYAQILCENGALLYFKAVKVD